MKISDYKGADGIELLADILEPAVEIIGDKRVKEAVSGGASRLDIVKALLKDHSQSILAILARINGVSPEEYNPNIFELSKATLELVNDKEIIDFFTLQAQMQGEQSFGDATENIKGKGK